MSGDEFNTTLGVIVTEFPNTNKWLKWHLDNDRGPLIFPSLSDGFISGFGRDTNGQEGIGGWIQRSYGSSRPNLTEGLHHLAIYGKQIDDDLKYSMSGFSNRYGKSSTPHERAAMAMIKRKKKSDFVKSDGRPPDTSKDAPTSTDDQGYDLDHMIPWSFHTVYPTPPHTRLFVTNTKTSS